MRECRNCGEEIRVGAKFCPNCGIAQGNFTMEDKTIQNSDIVKKEWDVLVAFFLGIFLGPFIGATLTIILGIITSSGLGASIFMAIIVSIAFVVIGPIISTIIAIVHNKSIKRT